MAVFLTTTDIDLRIIEMIRVARKQITLVSPYLQLREDWMEALHHAAERQVRIEVVYGKKKAQPEARERLAGIPNLTLYYLRHLHAKAYSNEQQMVIASMNLYAYSADNNWEMGVLLDRISDPDAYHGAMMQTRQLITAAQQQLQWRKPSTAALKQIGNHRLGRCIRCADQIAYSPAQPLCIDCYQETAKAKAPHYIEQNCHGCGIKAPVSLWYPLCSGCARAQDTLNTQAL